VRIDVGAHLDLLDLDDLLVLARLGSLLLVGVFQFAEIEDLDDGRLRVGRNLNEIQACLFGGQKRIVDGNIAAVVAVGIDKLDPGNPDIRVGARAVLGGRRCLEWSANGRNLLKPFARWISAGCANVVSAWRESIAQR
jgi:hypothetical protein